MILHEIFSVVIIATGVVAGCYIMLLLFLKLCRE
jgi:hypothetical protein